MNELNNEQQQLVEQNHNLIYSFAKSRKLDLEGYYDVLAIGLCKAALVFDENKGTFSTLAYKCMSNEYNKIIKKQTLKRKIPDNLLSSLDAVISVSEEDGSETTLYDYIKKDIFPIPDSSTITNIMIKNFYNNKLTKQEQKVFRLLVQDRTQVEIGKIMGITRSRVGQIVIQIRNKWIEFNK
jgi:RNA polymerase sigma factor (sigma-70 family)